VSAQNLSNDRLGRGIDPEALAAAAAAHPPVDVSMSRGDVLIFGSLQPHVGLPNSSGQIRWSIELRFQVWPSPLGLEGIWSVLTFDLVCLLVETVPSRGRGQTGSLFPCAVPSPRTNSKWSNTFCDRRATPRRAAPPTQPSSSAPPTRPTSSPTMTSGASAGRRRWTRRATSSGRRFWRSSRAPPCVPYPPSERYPSSGQPRPVSASAWGGCPL